MPNCPNQSAHDAAPSTPQLPPVPGPFTIGAPAGRAGPGAGPLRTCSRPPLRLCRVLFLFYSRPSRPPSALRTRSNHTRFSSSERRPKTLRTRSPLDQGPRPRRHADQLKDNTPSPIAHFGSASAVSFPNSGRRITTQISLAWTPRPIGDDGLLPGTSYIYPAAQIGQPTRRPSQHRAVSQESDFGSLAFVDGIRRPPALRLRSWTDRYNNRVGRVVLADDPRFQRPSTTSRLEQTPSQSRFRRTPICLSDPDNRRHSHSLYLWG